VLDRPPTSYSRSIFSDRAAATWLSTEIQEVAQIKDTIETWEAYAACADRRWLEPMVSVMFATARQLVPATSHCGRGGPDTVLADIGSYPAEPPFGGATRLRPLRKMSATVRRNLTVGHQF
jgi:hypothetical protein